MSDPLSAASLVISAIGTVQQGAAAAGRARLQAATARQQAERQLQLTAIEENRLRADTSRKLASQRARFAASGIDPSSGSALLSVENGAGEGEFQARLTRFQGVNRAFQLEQDARLALLSGRQAQQQSLFGAGTRLLNGADKFRLPPRPSPDPAPKTERRTSPR